MVHLGITGIVAMVAKMANLTHIIARDIAAAAIGASMHLRCAAKRISSTPLGCTALRILASIIVSVLHPHLLVSEEAVALCGAMDHLDGMGTVAMLAELAKYTTHLIAQDSL